MRATRYGRDEADSTTGQRTADEAEIRGLCAGIASDLALDALGTYLSGELYDLECYEAIKHCKPVPDGTEWQAGFRYGTTMALMRLFYAVPLPKWHDAVRTLVQEIRREAEVSQQTAYDKNQVHLPF